MDALELFFAGAGLGMREAALFAASGFALLGLGDLAIDAIWMARAVRVRFLELAGLEPPRADRLLPPARPGRMAIFVPAWDEADVIADMLRHALATFRHDDYRLYVGCYPNDPDTIAAVRTIEDPRIRLVVGPVPGPTTKADCLNRLWEAMLGDEAAEGRPVKAIVLHDAEDVVHSAELRLFDRLIERFVLVQIPVVPLIDPNSAWVAGHYADEFAESHGKELVVRQALGAAIPSAGVGCAFAREALGKVASRNGGLPFDRDSLTEDYELGLKLRAYGRSAFVRVRAGEGAGMVVTRGFFPGRLRAAVNQKARWMTGIALSGWDRLGWSGGFAERWFRLRDRQSILAALLTAAGYAALFLWLFAKSGEIFLGLEPPPITPTLALLLSFNAALLLWRGLVRAAFAAHLHGWREGLRSVPRMAVGNLIAILAAHQAVLRYIGICRTGTARWEKTAHAFPAELPAE